MEHIFYPDGGFGGVATREEVESLNKALTAGYGYAGAPTSLTGGAAMMMESIDASLRATTFQLKSLVLWPSLSIKPAGNTVEEYVRVTAYGSNGSPYFVEGGRPREETSSFNRGVQPIRYFGNSRRVSLPTMIVPMKFGDAVAIEINKGNMWILKNLERELYWGNAFFSNAGSFDGNPGAIPSDTLALNGIDQQVRQGDTDELVKSGDFSGFGGDATVIRNLLDAKLSPAFLNEGARVILNNFGMPSELHLDPKAHEDLSNAWIMKERLMMANMQPVSTAGYVLEDYKSIAGTFKVRANVFLRPKDVPFSYNIPVGVPAIPAIASAAVSGVAVGSTFALGETYRYKAAAIGDQGESLPCASFAGATAITTAGESFVVTITNVANAKAYALYRTNSAGAANSEQFIGFVKAAAGVSTVFTDQNKYLPGRAHAYLLFLDESAIVFKQLLPLVKINLATIAAAYEWMQLLMGTLILPTPRMMYLYDNIGRN